MLDVEHVLRDGVVLLKGVPCREAVTERSACVVFVLEVHKDARLGTSRRRVPSRGVPQGS